MTATARIYYAPSKSQLEKLCRKETIKESLNELLNNPDLSTNKELFDLYFQLKRELETL